MSLKKKECTICKHYGLETDESKALERELIFDESGTPVAINLCRHHAVELFRMGQKKFLVANYRILVDLIGSDEPKFLEILEKTVKKYPELIY